VTQLVRSAPPGAPSPWQRYERNESAPASISDLTRPPVGTIRGLRAVTHGEVSQNWSENLACTASARNLSRVQQCSQYDHPKGEKIGFANCLDFSAGRPQKFPAIPLWPADPLARAWIAGG
jgi:hypothetical protein